MTRVPKPLLMNMGFHYTAQFSRRTRVNVMGLVDHSTLEWEDWYDQTHEIEALSNMREAGYDLIEIHFLYGFGLKSERKEVELTKKMTANAHSVGLKVVGYFQFFSVQEELFFIENSWARECVQLKADGMQHQYDYDRPALCFSHEKVKQYYLDGVELGMKYCDLDGIRLDNDYFRGCYCPECCRLFREHLVRKFTPDEAGRVFGIRDLRGIVMPPYQRGSDPAWLELVKFRQEQRQDIMRVLKSKIISIKSDGVLGGNPAICRRIEDASRLNVYIPDLGETHDLVCAENNLFPARDEDLFRGQYLIYKYGQACGFSVFASHHIHDSAGKLRWPDTSEECALSLFEALAFGGHTPCTTWGIRKDGAATLYQRPEFICATTDVADFLKEHGELFVGAKCASKVGLYTNRESQISDAENCFASLQGAVSSLLKGKIPFRLVPFDTPEALAELELLIVPNVRFISEKQLELFAKFANQGGKVLMTGESAEFDEYLLSRKKIPQTDGFIKISETPEAIDLRRINRNGNYDTIPLPEKMNEFLEKMNKLTRIPFTISGGDFVCADLTKSQNGNLILFLLNYDNDNPVDLKVSFTESVKLVEIHSPLEFGVEIANFKDNILSIENLHTFVAFEFSN